MGISPCVALGILNESGLAAACEVDLGSAVAMKALHLASYEPVGADGTISTTTKMTVHSVPLRPMPASLMTARARSSITDLDEWWRRQHTVQCRAHQADGFHVAVDDDEQSMYTVKPFTRDPVRTISSAWQAWRRFAI
jgi:hypothetical protein